MKKNYVQNCSPGRVAVAVAAVASVVVVVAAVVAVVVCTYLGIPSIQSIFLFIYS